MRLLLIFFLIPSLASSQFSTREIKRWEAQAKRVTIIRDHWGVPHIYGKTDADAVFGLMYAQCEENFNQVEENQLEMLGRLSEVHGEGQLYNDLQMQLLYDTAGAKADYKKAPLWLKKLLDASADGVNFYLYKHPEVKPKLLKRFEPWFALLRTDGSIGATQTGGLTTRDMREMYPTMKQVTSFIERELPVYDLDPSGSNGFAVAPSKTASGNAILYINPHTTFYFRPEVHIVSEEGLNAYGAVTWGTFFVYQGFNEYCGWMHTSSYADVADLFEEKTEARPDGIYYLYDGKWLPAKKRQVVIRYKNGGQMEEEIFQVYSTIHGPVVGMRNGKWLALKENNRSMEALMQSWLRNKAKGFEAYKKIMDMRVNNSNNTVFADYQGNIAYWHGNFMPRRDTAYDYSRPVDGSTSATNWKGLHEVEQTVHVYNPKTGWIQNCNSTPFTAAGSSSPKKENYPEYMAPDGENFRAVNAVRLLEKFNGITIDTMIDSIGYNRYLSAFEYLQPALISSYDGLPENDSLRIQLSEAIELVRTWDRVPSKTSVAAALAIEWGYRMLQKASPPPGPYRNTDALGQLASALANTSAADRLNLFAETLRDIEKRFGSWKTAWGEINRYQRTLDGKFDDAKPSLPVGLAAASFGSLPSYATKRFSHTNRRYGVSGNSFVACVEFGKKVRAKSVLTGGQSFDPDSKHFLDQAEMYINGQFKEVLFYREDVMKHVERMYRPGEVKSQK